MKEWLTETSSNKQVRKLVVAISKKHVWVR